MCHSLALFLAVCSRSSNTDAANFWGWGITAAEKWSLGFFWPSFCLPEHLQLHYILWMMTISLMQVLLGYPYTVAIDMWSLGCMAAELFLGLPLFPGASEHDLLVRIVEMRGVPPDHVLAKAQHTKKYFERVEELSMVNGTAMSTLRYKVGAQF